jgi:hypothetical protein
MAGSIHPRLPHHPPPPTTAHLRLRIDPRPVSREAPARGPLAKSLDLVARSHGHGYDVLGGLNERSLLAAERSSWVVGVVVGGAVVWPVSVVVAVDIGTWDLLEKWMGRTGRVDGWRHDRKKKPRLVAVLEAEDGRLATEVTMEPSATKRGSRGRKTPADGRASPRKCGGWLELPEPNDRLPTGRGRGISRATQD